MVYQTKCNLKLKQQVNYEKAEILDDCCFKGTLDVGLSDGYIQVNHGKEAPLKRIQQGDWIVVYSPKLTMEVNVKCQSFTAIGQASDEEYIKFK